METKIVLGAGEGNWFGPHAFDSSIGNSVMFKVERVVNNVLESQVGSAVLVDAKVIQRGNAVELTLEVPTETIEQVPFLLDTDHWNFNP